MQDTHQIRPAIASRWWT